MIKSSLDFLGLWWELGHPTFPNQHFRALGSSIILDRGFRKLEFFILSDIGILFHQQKSTIFHHNPLLFFFCSKELCGQHDSFSHPPAEENPPGSEQRLRESLWALHRALAMPGVDHGRPAINAVWWGKMMTTHDATIRTGLGWIWDDWDVFWMFFCCFFTVATVKPIWRNVDFR